MKGKKGGVGGLRAAEVQETTDKEQDGRTKGKKEQKAGIRQGQPGDVMCQVPMQKQCVCACACTCACACLPGTLGEKIAGPPHQSGNYRSTILETDANSWSSQADLGELPILMVTLTLHSFIKIRVTSGRVV